VFCSDTRFSSDQLLQLLGCARSRISFLETSRGQETKRGHSYEGRSVNPLSWIFRGMSETDVLACTINRAPSIAVGVTSPAGQGLFEEVMVGSSWITTTLEEPASPAPIPARGSLVGGSDIGVLADGCHPRFANIGVRCRYQVCALCGCRGSY
jgi:hypothetical protein